MPENFSDTLGNWKSRAKDAYRRTTLAKAQAEFCDLLGSKPQDYIEESESARTERSARLIKMHLQRIFECERRSASTTEQDKERSRNMERG